MEPIKDKEYLASLKDNSVSLFQGLGGMFKCTALFPISLPGKHEFSICHLFNAVFDLSNTMLDFFFLLFIFHDQTSCENDKDRNAVKYRYENT